MSTTNPASNNEKPSPAFKPKMFETLFQAGEQPDATLMARYLSICAEYDDTSGIPKIVQLLLSLANTAENPNDSHLKSAPLATKWARRIVTASLIYLGSALQNLFCREIAELTNHNYAAALKVSVAIALLNCDLAPEIDFASNTEVCAELLFAGNDISLDDVLRYWHADAKKTCELLSQLCIKLIDRHLCSITEVMKEISRIQATHPLAMKCDGATASWTFLQYFLNELAHKRLSALGTTYQLNLLVSAKLAPH